MRILLIIPIILLAVACCPIHTTTSAAARGTYDAIAPEWEEMFREKYADDPAKIRRREILLAEWEAWVTDLEKAAEDQ